jgi:hypothetical protein
MTAEPEEPALNAFETAILQAIARETPSLKLDSRRLRVVTRKLTGVGSYTDFECDEAGERTTVSLKAHLAVPGVPKGMGAVLYRHGDQPQCLETFTKGDEPWTGAFEGFSLG